MKKALQNQIMLITYPDSLGREFYVLRDGSYIYSRDGKEEILGEAWKIADGKLEKISQAK